MKLVLIGVNASYSQSHPGLYSMVQYCEEQLTSALFASHELCIREFQINRPVSEVAAALYREKADVYAFSVYIWNAVYIDELLGLLHEMAPSARFMAGGPEVAYDREAEYDRQPLWDYLATGDGEETLLTLLQQTGTPSEILAWAKTYPSTGTVNPDKLPFIYPKFKENFQHRIAYYESSRGCPYQCSYCVSSLEPSPVFRSLTKVYEELDWFIENGFTLVKFLDRSFNFPPERARRIWSYLIKRTEGLTASERPCFHFELEASLLDEDSVALLEEAPQGLFQFEIGLQSIHPHILRNVHRKPMTAKGLGLLKRLLLAGKQHIHLDLIAGLPGETREELRQSYEVCWDLRPDMLQLGHLKLLRGTGMREEAERRGYKSNPVPPYEVVASDAMGVEDLLEADLVADMTDRYFNQNLLPKLLPLLPEKLERRPYDLMAAIGACYEKRRGESGRYLSREEQYLVIQDFLHQELLGAALAETMALVIEDYNATRKPGSLSWEKMSQKQHR